MSTSTASQILKKDNIIDGRLFVEEKVLAMVQKENEDEMTMTFVIKKLKNQGIYKFGLLRTEVYDEKIVEEFYQEAVVTNLPLSKGGDVQSISATVREIPIVIDRQMLEDFFELPSDGLTLEELETYGSEKLLKKFWQLFMGASADEAAHPSCHKKNFFLPFFYLHEFCCRVVENRTGAFEMCTGLRYRMMVAIMTGEPVNWCQIILKRLQEEVAKPATQKKSFGLALNNILALSGVRLEDDAKAVGKGKFIGGTRPVAYNKTLLHVSRPSCFTMSQAENPRILHTPANVIPDPSIQEDTEAQISAKKKTEKKKKKKSSEKKRKATSAEEDRPKKKKRTTKHIAVRKDAIDLQGPTPVEEAVPVAITVPEPEMATTKKYTLVEEITGDSATHSESIVKTPVRVPIPIQDPHFERVPTPSRNPSPGQASIPITEPVTSVAPTTDATPSPSSIIQDTLLQVEIDLAFDRFVQWKDYRTSLYETLYNWSKWKTEEDFVLQVTQTDHILPLFQWENEFCKDLITSYYIEHAEAQRKGKAVDPTVISSDSDHDSDDDDDAFQASLRMSRESAHEEAQNSSQVQDGQGTSYSHPTPTQEEALQDDLPEQLHSEQEQDPEGPTLEDMFRLSFPSKEPATNAEQTLSQQEEAPAAEPPQPMEISDNEDMINPISQKDSVPVVENEEEERQQERFESPVSVPTESLQEESVSQERPATLVHTQEQAEEPIHSPEIEEILRKAKAKDAPETSYRLDYFAETNEEEEANQPESPRTKQKKALLEEVGLKTMFLQDTVQALYSLGKEIDWLRETAMEEVGGLKRELSDVAEAIRSLPPSLTLILWRLKNRQEELLKAEQSKLRVCENKSAEAMALTAEHLRSHDSQIKDMAEVLTTLVRKVNSIEETQQEATKLLISIDTKVSSVDESIKGEEARAKAKQWRLQQEKQFEESLEETVAAAIEKLAKSSSSQRVTGSRPEFFDPNIDWRTKIHCPSAINLPTHRHPSEDEVRKWRKNEVLRYFVFLAKESAVFRNCKTLQEAAILFNKMLDEGNLPLQLVCASRHRKGERMTHDEDWILAFVKEPEIRDQYKTRGREALTKFWKGHANDPDAKPWRHATASHRR
ncbi:hypothetical protein OROGR_005522 [Orobanche gracilis]